MEACYFSNHIPMSSVASGDLNAILSDIRLFNRMKHKATRLKTASERFDEDSGKAKGGSEKPDLRKKENKALRKSLPPSLHMQLKAEFGVNDYFANSAVQSASAAVKSAKELVSVNKDNTRADIKDIKAKLKGKRMTLTKLERLKASIIRVSKARKDGKDASGYYNDAITTFNADGSVVREYQKGNKTFMNRWDNVYLFEVRFLDPALKRTRSNIKNLEQKLEHKEAVLKKLDRLPGICYGSKALFKKQRTVYKDKHDVWRSVFDKRRNKALLISGRKDAAGGNFVFCYDPVTGDLTYKSQSDRIVTLHNVRFPYGQDNVNKAVLATGKDRSAVAYSIEISKGSLLVKCMVCVAPDDKVNDFYRNGCIAFDTNYDNFAVVELDGSGNVLSHSVIPFDLEGLSSGQAKHVLSLAADKIIKLAEARHKPVAMEDLKVKNKPSSYGNRKTNRKLSGFAYATITGLIHSKTVRHCIGVTEVPPHYTSQTGKIKFMRKHGVSIHEAAAIAIGRRALGIKERLPDHLKRKLTPDELKEPVIKQWKAVYRITNSIRPKEMYSWNFAS